MPPPDPQSIPVWTAWSLRPSWSRGEAQGTSAVRRLRPWRESQQACWQTLSSAMTPLTYGPGALPTAARALVLGEGVSAPHSPSGPLHESPGRCLQGPSLHAGPEGQGAWHGARAPRVSWGKVTDSCKASRRSAAKPRVGVLTSPRLCAAYLPRGVLLPLAVEELPSGRFQRELFPVKLQVWGVCEGAELRVFLGRHHGLAPPGKASSLYMSILLMLPKLRI